MKVTIDAAHLALSVKVAGTAVAARPIDPVLAGVHVIADPEHLELSSFDFEASARSRCAATIHEPGAMLVAHRLLAGICASIKAGSVRIETDEAGPVTVTAGRSVWRLPRMDDRQFPTIPPAGEVFATVDGAEFARAVEKVQAAAGTDPHANLNCVYLGVRENALELAGSDRHRLHVAPIDAELVDPSAVADGDFLLIDARRLAVIAKHLSPGPVALRCTPSVFAVGDVNGMVTMRLTEPEGGRWIDYEQLLARTVADPRATVRVGRVDMLTALRQVVGFSEVADGGVRLMTVEFRRDGVIALNAGTDADGSGSTVIDSQHEGPGLRMILNAGYLGDALATLDAPVAHLMFSGPTRPVGLAADGAQASAVVMPIRQATSVWLDELAEVGA